MLDLSGCRHTAELSPQRHSLYPRKKSGPAASDYAMTIGRDSSNPSPPPWNNDPGGVETVSQVPSHKDCAETSSLMSRPCHERTDGRKERKVDPNELCELFGLIVFLVSPITKEFPADSAAAAAAQGVSRCSGRGTPRHRSTTFARPVSYSPALQAPARDDPTTTLRP